MEDPQFAVAQLAQTTMRSELGTNTITRVSLSRTSAPPARPPTHPLVISPRPGKLSLDTVFKERAALNVHIVGMSLT